MWLVNAARRRLLSNNSSLFSQGPLTQMNPLLDHLLHGGEGLTFILTAWYVIRYINRRESIEKDYPPHRHIGAHISYPPDRAPGRVEHMETGD